APGQLRPRLPPARGRVQEVEDPRPVLVRLEGERPAVRREVEALHVPAQVGGQVGEGPRGQAHSSQPPPFRVLVRDEVERLAVGGELPAEVAAPLALPPPTANPPLPAPPP